MLLFKIRPPTLNKGQKMHNKVVLSPINTPRVRARGDKGLCFPLPCPQYGSSIAFTRGKSCYKKDEGQEKQRLHIPGSCQESPEELGAELRLSTSQTTELQNSPFLVNDLQAAF